MAGKPSPDFDRVLTALRCQEPDRVPLGELWVDPSIKAAFLGRTVHSLEDDIAFWEAAGYDFIVLDAGFWDAPQVQESTMVTAPDLGGGDRSWVKETGIIQTMEDVERFSWPMADSIDLRPYQQIAGLLPNHMKVLVSTGHIFTTAWQLMGFENFCLALSSDIELIREVIARIGQESIFLLRKVLSFKEVGAVCFQDDIAFSGGLLIPPHCLKELFFPWLAQAADICHAFGRPLIYHSDGKLDQVLPHIIATGVDGLHSIEPKCMDIVAVKRTYGKRLALIGNIDLNYTLTRGTIEEVREAVRYLITHVAPGGGFLLGSSNSITNYVPFCNYQAMIEATFEYGHYPISLHTS